MKQTVERRYEIFYCTVGPRSLDSTASMFLCTLQPLLSDACFVVSRSTHFLASLVHCGGTKSSFFPCLFLFFFVSRCTLYWDHFVFGSQTLALASSVSHPFSFAALHCRRCSSCFASWDLITWETHERPNIRPVCIEVWRSYLG